MNLIPYFVGRVACPRHRSQQCKEGQASGKNYTPHDVVLRPTVAGASPRPTV